MPDKKKKIRGNDPKWSMPNKPSKGKGMRSIHRQSGEWLWKTNGYQVIIWSPNRTRFQVTVDELWDTADEDPPSWWGSWDGYGWAIVPCDVNKYIAHHLERRI